SFIIIYELAGCTLLAYTTLFRSACQAGRACFESLELFRIALVRLRSIAELPDAGDELHHRALECQYMGHGRRQDCLEAAWESRGDRMSTRLNSSHVKLYYAVFCL